MITVEYEKSMYDSFIEKSELTTKELLSIGFTNKDLTRLKERGKLASVRRGVYKLVDSNGLFLYSRELVGREEYARSELALDRCLEINPNDGTMAASVLLASIMSGNFHRAIESLGILEQTDNDFYKHDHNLWTFLLSYSTEMPDEYKGKLKTMTFDDISVLDDDSRYSDVELANRIRKMVLDRRFGEASDLMRNTKEIEERKLYARVTFKLLNFANHFYYDRRGLYLDLIGDENYSQLVNVLTEDQEKWGLTKEEKYVLDIAKQMVWMSHNQMIPKAKGLRSITFDEAMRRQNYVMAKELYDYNFSSLSGDKDSSLRKDRLLVLMLKKINSEIDNMKAIKAAREAGSNEFSLIVEALMNHDLDNALDSIERYLVQIDRHEYSMYIASLIKLSLLDNDMSFTEPMLALSRLSRDDYRFDASIYIQDFYFNLTGGNLRRAAVYLDIISTSKDVGGVAIDVSDMRKSLVSEMNRLGLADEAYTIDMPDVKAKDAVVVANGAEKKSSKDELATEYCHLSSVIENVLKDDNIAMLAPMSEEDTERVMQLLSQVSNIQSFVVDSTDGKSKHVVLKYCGKVGEFINRGQTIKAASSAYFSKNWEQCIDLYEEVLPLLKKPKSFVYSQLGVSYQKLASNTDFSDAIDYLTLATAVSKTENVANCDYSSLVERLKIRSGYNGIKVNASDAEMAKLEAKNGIQYVKK